MSPKESIIDQIHRLLPNAPFSDLEFVLFYLLG